MVSSEFGAPGEFLTGFNPAKAARWGRGGAGASSSSSRLLQPRGLGVCFAAWRRHSKRNTLSPARAPPCRSHYGSKLHVWDWEGRKRVQTIDLGPEGAIPLEVRFAHDPAAPWGYVGCALSSNVVLLKAGPEGAPLETKVAIKQPWLKVGAPGAAWGHGVGDGWGTVPAGTRRPQLGVNLKPRRVETGKAAPPRPSRGRHGKTPQKVDGWVLEALPPLVTDILISLDDKRLFFSNWLRGRAARLFWRGGGRWRASRGGGSGRHPAPTWLFAPGSRPTGSRRPPALGPGISTPAS
jgi:hypothetical protein